MANVSDLRDLFVDELKDIYSAEQQITEALPKMAEKAHNTQLRNAFNQHLKQTERQIERLDKVSEELDIKLSGETCKAMKGIIEEGEEIIGKTSEGDGILDAVLIAAAQKVEHYEIASYGTVVTYAEQLGENKVADLLKQTLNEEKTTDEKLSELAKKKINKEAE